MVYDVLIVGGGAARYGCALTLASVENTQEWAKQKKYLMIDSGDSDILKASFFNVAGVELGIGGDSLLKKMKTQLSHYQSCSYKNDTVKKIIKKEDVFVVSTAEESFEAKIVVLATGMHKFEIECDLVEKQEHKDVMKPNKICLKNSDNQIRENLFVAGLESGAKTMFAIASGEGARVT